MIMNARRDGFAVPMAILLIGVITAGVVGAFARVESENAVINNVDAQAVAYAHAESGIGEYLSERNFPADMTYTFPGGGAQVRAEQIRADDGVNGALYMVHSTGVALQGSALPPAQHSVVQLAWLVPYNMNVPAGWTSLSGIRKNGNSGTMSGYDQCGMKAALPGVAVPTGGYSGHENPVRGEPPIQEMGTQDEMKDAVDIDWEGFINGDVIDFDITIGDDAWPNSTWFADNPSRWPVIYVDNPGSTFDPGDMNGRGILVIRGDLKLDGGDKWEGIVMVGGRITDNGTGAISGAVISGLNVKLGETVEESSRANGTKTYDYNSCHVASAMSGAATLTAIRNTWFDGWAAY